MEIRCVGAIIRDGAGRIVVVRRGRQPSKGLWSLPGGRVEPGETFQDAVRREVAEETGMQVDVGRAAGSVVLPAIDAEDTYLVTDYFASAQPESPRQPVAGDDAADARWVTRRELRALDLTPGLGDTLDAWQVWADRPDDET